MIAAAAIVLLALALAGGAGTIGALIQARRAEREAVATARREASVSAAISAFLNQDLLATASPRSAGRR